MKKSLPYQYRTKGSSHHLLSSTSNNQYHHAEACNLLLNDSAVGTVLHVNTATTSLDSKRMTFFHKQSYRKPSSLKMADETPAAKESSLPMLLDVGTKGGALFLSLLLFIAPIIGYEIATIGFGVDGIEAGRWIGVGFTFFTTVLWVGSYIFRVATKDMTYVSRVSVDFWFATCKHTNQSFVQIVDDICYLKLIFFIRLPCIVGQATEGLRKRCYCKEVRRTRRRWNSGSCRRYRAWWLLKSLIGFIERAET